MKLSLLDGLIPTPDPEPLIKPRWGTVTQASPLRVQLDGDTAALPITPTTVVSGLVVGSRVWCVLTGKQLVIVGSVAVLGVPPGTIQIFAGSGNNLPSGWLGCWGGGYSPTTYPRLFAAIGNLYGGTAAAPLLPSLIGRAPVGVDDNQAEFNVVGKVGGSKVHMLTIAEMPAHGHPITSSLNGTNAYYNGWPSFTNPGANGVGNMYTQNAGGGGNHNNLQPYICMNYIIQAV